MTKFKGIGFFRRTKEKEQTEQKHTLPTTKLSYYIDLLHYGPAYTDESTSANPPPCEQFTALLNGNQPSSNGIALFSMTIEDKTFELHCSTHILSAYTIKLKFSKLKSAQSILIFAENFEELQEMLKVSMNNLCYKSLGIMIPQALYNPDLINSLIEQYKREDHVVSAYIFTHPSLDTKQYFALEGCLSNLELLITDGLAPVERTKRAQPMM